MAVSINVDGEQRRKRNERLKRLTAEAQFYSSETTDETMDTELYQFAKAGNVDAFIDVLEQVSSKKQLSLSTIFNQLTPSGNSLLHVAASYGSRDITQLVADQFLGLITKKNLQGDTALHLAARAGELNTTEVLLSRADTTLLRMKNNNGNTALHDAVVGGHHNVVWKLVAADPDATHKMDNEGKSPLYLAAKAGDEGMVDILLRAMPEDSDLFSKLEGKSAIHAAIKGKKLGILEKIANKIPKLLIDSGEKLGSPIHFASSVGFVGGVRFLLEKSGDGALQRNQDGLYPIHLAAQNGHVRVVMEFAKKWSYPLEFLNNDRQNILHVAAKNGRENVVRYILKTLAHPKHVNEKDNEGNTPLHLAAKNGHSVVVFALVRDKRVNRTIVNNLNLTPYRVAENQSKVVEEDYEKSGGKSEPVESKKVKGEKNITIEDSKSSLKKEKQADANIEKNRTTKQPNEKLDYYGVMMALSVLHFYASPRKSLIEYLRIQNKPLPKEEMKSRIEFLLVVAVLVAGVTFAGAITLPEGVSKNNTSPNNSTGIAAQDPILRNLYIYFDMVALNASVMASLILCAAQVYNVKLASHAVWLASILIGGSIYLMCLAFFFAVAIAVSTNTASFIIIIIVGGSLFLIQTVLSVPLIIPPSANQIVERVLSPFVYFIIFLFYFMVERFLGKLSEGSNKE